MAVKKSVAGTAQDPTIQFSTVTIDEQEYKLAYSFNALALAEAETGCNLLDALQSLFAGLTALQLRGLFFAALRVAHPETTIEQASSLCRVDTIIDIGSAIAKAYYLSLPEKKRSQLEALPEIQAGAETI